MRTMLWGSRAGELRPGRRLGQHVVGRGDDGAEVDLRRVVADAGERFEARPRRSRLAQAVAGGSACQDRAVTVVLDLDGVVWLADQPIPGAADAVARLRAGRSPGAVRDQQLLRRRWPTWRPSSAAIGIPAAGDVVTSAMAAARLVRAGRAGARCAAGRARPRRWPRRGPRSVDRRRRRRRRGRLPPQLRLRRAAPGVHGRARAAPGSSAPTTTPPIPRPTGPIPGGGAILAAVGGAARA